jgi:hypothetical protein
MCRHHRSTEATNRTERRARTTAPGPRRRAPIGISLAIVEDGQQSTGCMAAGPGRRTINAHLAAWSDEGR